MMSTPHPPATAPFAGALLGSPGRRLFSSRDLDETRTLVGRVMKPHGLDVAGRSQRLDARMHHVAIGEVSLSRLAYGADVTIQPGPLGDFYLVQMPIVGCAQIESGRQQVDSSPQIASVLSPDAATTMRWARDCDQIMVRIARPLVERALLAQLGEAPNRPLEFQLGFHWRDCPAWQCLMAYLLECAARDLDLTRHTLLAAQIERLVVATLMSMHAHNFSDARPRRQGAIAPRHVRKVQDHLQAHAHEPISPDQLAVIAGVSLRSLYAGFKSFCGVGPMQYLKELRFERAHAELQAGPAAANVASVALAWGFGHLGRFSADYKARFGESPSETLRRR